MTLQEFIPHSALIAGVLLVIMSTYSEGLLGELEPDDAAVMGLSMKQAE